MARKTNQMLMIVGASVGIGAAIYIIKNFTKLLDPLTDALQSQKVRDSLDDLWSDAKSSYNKVFTDISRKAKVKYGISSGKPAVRKAAVSQTKKTAAASKAVKRVVKAGASKADSLLESMDKGRQYTQREIADLTNIPYRTVRRYVETLVKSGSLSEEGYGKGKEIHEVKFSRKIVLDFKSNLNALQWRKGFQSSAGYFL